MLIVEIKGVTVPECSPKSKNQVTWLHFNDLNLRLSVELRFIKCIISS